MGAQVVLSTRLLLNLREGYYREINGTTTEWGEVNLPGLEFTPEQTEAGVVREGHEIGFCNGGTHVRRDKGETSRI
jgi:hypothetical protein